MALKTMIKNSSTYKNIVNKTTGDKNNKQKNNLLRDSIKLFKLFADTTELP